MRWYSVQPIALSTRPLRRDAPRNGPWIGDVIGSIVLRARVGNAVITRPFLEADNSGPAMPADTWPPDIGTINHLAENCEQNHQSERVPVSAPFRRRQHFSFDCEYGQTSIYRRIPDMANFGGLSRLAVYRRWRNIEVGGISRLAVYRGWRYIEGGGISRLALY